MPSPQPVAVLEQVLLELQQQMRKEQFDTWFRGVELGQLTDEEVEFVAPSGFVRDWLNRNYLQTLQSALRAVTGKDLRVRVRLDREAADETRPGPDLVVESDLAEHREDIHEIMGNALGGPSTCGGEGEHTAHVSTATPLPSLGRGDSLHSETPLNQDYTFDQYVVGPCNRLSHAAALAIGQNPGRAYNPLFVHGNVGLGKTHLLQAICHAIKRKPEPSRVLYLSCEEFTNKFILAIQMGRLNDFREFYRAAEVLVIDDVQFLEGKAKKSKQDKPARGKSDDAEADAGDEGKKRGRRGRKR